MRSDSSYLLLCCVNHLVAKGHRHFLFLPLRNAVLPALVSELGEGTVGTAQISWEERCDKTIINKRSHFLFML